MGILYGRAWRLTSKNGGFRPGQEWVKLMQQTAEDAEDGPPGSVSSQAPVVEGHSPAVSQTAHMAEYDAPIAFLTSDNFDDSLSVPSQAGGG